MVVRARLLRGALPRPCQRLTRKAAERQANERRYYLRIRAIDVDVDEHRPAACWVIPDGRVGPPLHRALSVHAELLDPDWQVRACRYRRLRVPVLPKSRRVPVQAGAKECRVKSVGAGRLARGQANATQGHPLALPELLDSPEGGPILKPKPLDGSVIGLGRNLSMAP